MKKTSLSVLAFIGTSFLLLLLFTTCKRQNNNLSPKGSRIENGNDEFIVWHVDADTNKIKRQITEQLKADKEITSQSIRCTLFAHVTAYGVTRTGSCSGGYSYTLRLDNIIIFGGSTVGLQVYINGVPFTPTQTGPGTYSVAASYSSFGIADADYCNTNSLNIVYANFCTSTSQTIQLTPSEACGSTNPDVTSTAAHYSYPPTTMTLPRSGGADLGLLVNLCNTCTVRYPDFYVFQYRPTGTTNWTTDTVAYPQYLFHSVSLPSGTYDLQGNNECAPGGTIPNNGPTVSGSPTTFTVL